MADSENQLKDALQRLGLTENEAKIIIGMVKIGAISDAATISKVSDVPRSKIYTTLKKLDELGLISIIQIEGGTNHYEALKIDSILEILKKTNEDTLKDAFSTAKVSLTKLHGSLEISTEEQLDFISIKGRDRIIKQILDLLEIHHDPSVRIMVNVPYFTYKTVSRAVLEKLIEICNHSPDTPNLDILINREELVEISKLHGSEILKKFFLLVPLPPKDKNVQSDPVKLPITEPSSNLFTNISNIFESRPFFIIIGTESAFIIIEKDSASTALRIQNKTFLQLQQDIINSLFAVIKKFGMNFS